jgi:hypothetical protein
MRLAERSAVKVSASVQGYEDFLVLWVNRCSYLLCEIEWRVIKPGIPDFLNWYQAKAEEVVDGAVP